MNMAAGRTEEADRRDLVDVAEDLLDQVAALRKDIRPIISLGWALLGLILIMLLFALVSTLVALAV
jgi:hypothetical protein